MSQKGIPWERITFADNKWATMEGINRQNINLYRGAEFSKENMPLVPERNEKYPLKVHFLFVGNSKGVSCFMHAHEEEYKTKCKGWKNGNKKWVNRNVNGDEMLQAMKKCVIPFMKKTGSDILLQDCCGPGHDKKIYEELEKHKI